MIALNDRYVIGVKKLANAVSQSEKFPRKLENELDWKADENFDTGIVKTVEWYLNKYGVNNG
ncbi:hypothetical protein LF845_10810 [Deferribacterales bacterium Es71-Z0220]|uniref:hypothetical protein n=1 Tax=Deferrivibrio essentukiensis TaxID=2880922 RepID=UPI001F61529E|nr:hypothetical protein [Deferrivibrio essentukiensis]MCB4205444.1 hypothetical protein [Deferrivibrio essentukiensis]